MAGKGRFPLVSALGHKFRRQRKNGHPAQPQIAFCDYDTTERAVWLDWFFEAAASDVSGTGTTGQSAQTTVAAGLELIAGSATASQGSQTAVAAGDVASNLSGFCETGQGGQTSTASGQTTGEQPAPVGFGPSHHLRYPTRIVGSADSGQGTPSTVGTACVTLLGTARTVQRQSTVAAGRLTLVGAGTSEQRQSLRAAGTVDRFARARQEDELWLLAA